MVTIGNQFMKKKTLLLKGIPEDAYEKLLQLQALEKIKCKCQKSLETVIYNLIRKAVLEK